MCLCLHVCTIFFVWPLRSFQHPRRMTNFPNNHFLECCYILYTGKLIPSLSYHWQPTNDENTTDDVLILKLVPYEHGWVRRSRRAPDRAGPWSGMIRAHFWAFQHRQSASDRHAGANTVCSRTNTVASRMNTAVTRNQHGTHTDDQGLPRTYTEEPRINTNQHGSYTDQHDRYTDQHDCYTNQHDRYTDQHGSYTDQHGS